MRITFSKKFLKQAKKLRPPLRQKLQERIGIFRKDPLHPRLRNHELKGKYKAYRSIDITGGLRALYVQREDEAVFDVVGTHSQLYG